MPCIFYTKSIFSLHKWIFSLIDIGHNIWLYHRFWISGRNSKTLFSVSRLRYNCLELRYTLVAVQCAWASWNATAIKFPKLWHNKLDITAKGVFYGRGQQRSHNKILKAFSDMTQCLHTPIFLAPCFQYHIYRIHMSLTKDIIRKAYFLGASISSIQTLQQRRTN